MNLFLMPRRSDPNTAYAPAPDGQRFLVNTLVNENSAITIVLNLETTDALDALS
jgi:hypothetical protein